MSPFIAVDCQQNPNGWNGDTVFQLRVKCSRERLPILIVALRQFVRWSRYRVTV